MKKNEFHIFMSDQIHEINNYKEIKIIICPELSSNECVFEWIDNYADAFRENWEFINLNNKKKQCK